MQTRMLLTDI